MNIQQFYDEGLAHASYAILSEGKVALVDPGRNPQQYSDFAQATNAKIVAVIETHPHADFVSSHLEFHKNEDAKIYVSRLVGAEYPHVGFDEGDSFHLGNVTLHALHTPGHSPDSISILLKDENGKDHALFSGDTLFIGDLGRPDLREKAGNLTAQREELAKMMYHTVQNKLKPWPMMSWYSPPMAQVHSVAKISAMHVSLRSANSEQPTGPSMIWTKKNLH